MDKPYKYLVVELPRFELRITEPKSAVLPLHHSSIVARKRRKDSVKFSIYKILGSINPHKCDYTSTNRVSCYFTMRSRYWLGVHPSMR